MLSSSILCPSDCPAQALADFERLVVEGGAVDRRGLTRRIRGAYRLLFLRSPDGQLVGVGALKQPRSAYRDRVFAKARATVSSHRYNIELGWVVVAESHQGRRLSARIIGELLALARNENVFATTRLDERTLRLASAHGFEPHGNCYPSGRGYDLVLYLHNAPPQSANEHESAFNYRHRRRLSQKRRSKQQQLAIRNDLA
jgi:GNAT superfamily N-acetyltransferase